MIKNLFLSTQMSWKFGIVTADQLFRSLVKGSMPGTMPWQGDFDRLDSVQHARFWRYVTGDDIVDTSFETALTRMHLA